MFEIEIGKLNRNVEMTAVDWPNVLEVAKEHARAAGLADRYHVIAGDAFQVDYGRGYDIALVTGFLHHFDPATAERLLRKVRDALVPGGRLSIVEFVPNADRVSPAGPAAFSLTMLAATANGDAYTLQEFQKMLANAGFQAGELHPLVPDFLSAIIASK
jgi:cyclopropane fatty-acyl-phospholipid synthase-like methyltransferase